MRNIEWVPGSWVGPVLVLIAAAMLGMKEEDGETSLSFNLPSPACLSEKTHTHMFKRSIHALRKFLFVFAADDFVDFSLNALDTDPNR